MDSETYIRQLLPHLLQLHAVGSKVTCNPAPTNTDEDWLALIQDYKFDTTISSLSEAGFELDNPSEHYRPELSTFNSWRGPNNLNLIVTSDDYWHQRFLAASAIAKRLNVMTKADRVALFQAMLYTNYDGSLLNANQTPRPRLDLV